MNLEKRISLAFDFTTPTYIGSSLGYDISDHPTLRVTVENAGGTNVIVVEAKLDNETNWTNLDTITGTGTKYVDISSYERVRFRCSQYHAAGLPRLVFASFFKRPIRTAIEIGCPNGDSLETTSFNFISSDNSVIITGNASTNEIDLQAAASGATFSSLTDVNFAALQDGNTVKYDSGSGKWINTSELNDVQTQNPVIILENNTGGTISKYTPVIVNTSGDMDYVVVSDSSKITVVGLTVADVNDGNSGEIRSDRVLKNVTIPFNFGDTLYVNKLGGLTNILPSVGVNGFLAGDFVIKIGTVSKNQTNPLLKDIILDPDTIVQLT